MKTHKKLVINLIEYKTINELTIIGEKSKRYKKEIKKILKLKEKNPFIKSFLADDISFIKKLYSSLGYNFVEIEKKVKDVENTNDVINEDNIVKSPMVGVAYLSADPNSQPYVKVGQHVKAGDTLLLIEAMKTFNEIKAPRSGIIKKIVILNSQPVEYGDTLIIFE